MDDVFAYKMDLAINNLVVRLPPVEAAAIENTQWRYAPRPAVSQMHGFPPDGIMLGLYEAPRAYSADELLSPDLPPPTITLFTDNLKRLGYTPAQVVTHEAGHRLGYEHTSAAVVPCGTQYSAMTDIVRAVESLPPAAPIECFC